MSNKLGDVLVHAGGDLSGHVGMFLTAVTLCGFNDVRCRNYTVVASV